MAIVNLSISLDFLISLKLFLCTSVMQNFWPYIIEKQSYQ